MSEVFPFFSNKDKLNSRGRRKFRAGSGLKRETGSPVTVSGKKFEPFTIR